MLLVKADLFAEYCKKGIQFECSLCKLICTKLGKNARETYGMC